MTDAAAAALSPMPPPAIRIEKECLHDAEEAGTYDYVVKFLRNFRDFETS